MQNWNSGNSGVYGTRANAVENVRKQQEANYQKCLMLSSAIERSDKRQRQLSGATNLRDGNMAIG
jgi:hypothetical protein